MPPERSEEVDVTLIRWMLSLTPAERLSTLEEFVEDMQEATSQHAQRQISLDPPNAC